MSKNFVDLDNARQEDQKAVMKNIVTAQHCPFCLENLRKYHKQPIEKNGQFWILTKNQWPYEHTKHHYLAILKRHATTLSDLTEQEGAELIQLMTWLEKYVKAPGGGIAIRFGDTNYSAGTVSHLHAQFIVPDITAHDFEPTRFKIGKSSEFFKK